MRVRLRLSGNNMAKDSQKSSSNGHNSKNGNNNDSNNGKNKIKTINKNRRRPMKIRMIFKMTFCQHERRWLTRHRPLAQPEVLESPPQEQCCDAA
eukprot:6246117-Amphidinium_carterae.2